jgi:MFS family permease
MSVWRPEVLQGFDRNFWILSFGWFIAALGFAISIPFLSIYFSTQLGLSTSEIGLFFVGIAVVRAISQAVGGELSDRIGRFGLVVHSQTVRSLSFIALGLAVGLNWGFWWVAILFGVNAIFGSLFMPAVMALVSDLLPPEKRLNGYSIARSASNLGWAVGPAIGGFMATSSYASLFYISAILSFGSMIVFRLFFKPPPIVANLDRFRYSDLLAVKDDKLLAVHAGLTLILYLVVAQLIAPFSLYTVGMRGIPEHQLGMLFTLNGLFVVLFQFPVTRLLSHLSFTTQLAAGAFLYFIGYGMVDFMGSFWQFALAIFVITLGEVTMSPPGLTLTSRLAPVGRTGRYMGIRGFCETLGWSLGPMYGGFFLDILGHRPEAAWLLISSLALVAAIGYFIFGRMLPARFNSDTGDNKNGTVS